MKLAIVTHNIIKGDGQGRVNYEIAKRALQKGHNVTLIANRVDTALTELGASWIPIHPKFFNQVDLFLCYEFAHRANRLLSAMPDTQKADIIHAYGHTLSIPHHVNTSQFVHDAWLRSPFHSSKLKKDVNSAYQWLFSSLNARWEKDAYGLAKRVVAASYTVRKDLEEIGVKKEKLSVITNGVDVGEFNPSGTANRATLGLPSEEVTLALFAGDIRSGRKNLESVLKALVAVPDVHLGVVGGLKGSSYPELAKTLGLAGRIHFLDYRRDVADIMRVADFFVFPSRYEPFGNVILEAMASGLPVITSANVGAASAVTPECGIVLDSSDDVAGLTRSMTELACNKMRREAMSKAACLQAQNYSWDRIADQYLDLYSEVSGR